MKKISRIAVLLASFSVPVFVAAQTGINLAVVRPYSQGIIDFINGILVPVLMAIAFIVFLWGVYKYFILGADDEKSRADGRQFTLWGIIGFVVILSVWGLIAIVRGAFGLTTGNAPTPPTFGTPPASATSNSYFYGGGEP